MKVRWIIICLVVLCVFSGCVQGGKSKTQQVKPNAKSKQSKVLRAKSATPDLAGGPEKNVRKPHPLSLADLRKKYRSTFILNGSPSKREIALTFDDAPDDHFTPLVLDTLKREGVKATFFVVGNRVEAHPEIVKRMVEEGHLLGNHSYNHANLPKISDAEFRKQVIKTDNLIRQYTGYTPNIIRPPYGNISEGQIQWLASQGKKVVNWNVDSLDSRAGRNQCTCAHPTRSDYPASLRRWKRGGFILYGSSFAQDHQAAQRRWGQARDGYRAIEYEHSNSIAVRKQVC